MACAGIQTYWLQQYLKKSQKVSILDFRLREGELKVSEYFWVWQKFQAV